MDQLKAGKFDTIVGQLMGVPYNNFSVDDYILELTTDFMDDAQKDNKPFFVWLNPTRMHVFTNLSPEYKALMTPENNWTIQEAGMAQFDDIVGSVMKQVEEMGETDNTIIIVTTDNGTQSFSWPDGGNSPFKGDKGSANEGGFRSPAVIRWPGKVAPNRVINGLISGMDWLPTFVSAAGNKDIKKELLDGKSMGGKDYKVHLDGYDQTEMLVNEGASTRNELWYFTQGNLAAVRLGDDKIVLLDQPNGWLAGTVKLNWPKLYNLRLDPFERLGFGPGESKFSFSAFYAHEFWCFVNLQEEVGLLAKTAIEYPAMQEGASFNLDAVKEQIKGLQHKAGK